MRHYLAERETAGTGRRRADVRGGSPTEAVLRRRCRSRSSTSWRRSTISARRCCQRPASTRRRRGSATPYPDNVGAALDDGARPTASGALQVGDRSLAPPVALGVDDWSLVWGARLPQPTVDQLASIVVADSFRPIDRGGLICAIAVFETANPTDAATVLAAMQTWAAAAPAGAQSTVTQLADTRVQLSSCDPGADAATVPQPGDVDALINRQLTRLAG